MPAPRSWTKKAGRGPQPPPCSNQAKAASSSRRRRRRRRRRFLRRRPTHGSGGASNAAYHEPPSHPKSPEGTARLRRWTPETGVRLRCRNQRQREKMNGNQTCSRRTLRFTNQPGRQCRTVRSIRAVEVDEEQDGEAGRRPDGACAGCGARPDEACNCASQAGGSAGAPAPAGEDQPGRSQPGRPEPRQAVSHVASGGSHCSSCHCRACRQTPRLEG